MKNCFKDWSQSIWTGNQHKVQVGTVRTAKIQRSLCIHTVWAESYFYA